MTRETKYNLIFLAVLLPLLAPGLVVLVSKKMEPGSAPMYMPKAVRQQAAYNDPSPKRPGIERITPLETAQWIAQLGRQNLGPDARTVSGYVSDGRRVELAAVETFAGETQRIAAAGGADEQATETEEQSPKGGSAPASPGGGSGGDDDRSAGGESEAASVAWRAGLVYWRDRPATRVLDGAGRSVRVEQQQPLNVPVSVRRDLQDLGFVDPPRRVTWLRLRGAWPPPKILVIESAGQRDQLLLVDAWERPSP